jgi:hypothetical protein
LRPLATHEECIDFLQSELLLEDVTIPDVKEKLLVETFEEFVAIENVVHYPKFLLINYVRIQNDCPLHFFVLKNAYGLPTYFISEHLRNIFDEEKISGIRFMELDEQL